MTVNDISDIKTPGTMFSADGINFVSDGITQSEMNVIRLDSHASRDAIDLDVLKREIADGNVKLLSTHEQEYQQAVPKEDLLVAMEFLASDPSLDGAYPGESEIATAVQSVEDSLPGGAYDFRYRDE